MATSTDETVTNLIINDIPKSVYDSVSHETDELYVVDMQFSGGKVLATDGNGQIIETNVPYITLNDLAGETLEPIVTVASGDSVTLENRTIYTDNTVGLTSLTIVAPSSANERFVAEVLFSSGSTATSFSYPSTFKIMEGCDDVVIVSGIRTFVPVVNKRYTVFVDYDGVNFVLTAKGV